MTNEEAIIRRKRKKEDLKKKVEIEEENKQKKADLDEMLRKNEVSKSQIMHKDCNVCIIEDIKDEKKK